MKIRTLTLLILTIVFSSCASIQKLMDQGRYDEAIKKITKKLQGKKLKEPELVIALETAFNKVNNADLDRIRQLNINEDWRNQEHVLAITKKIQKRQALISPLVPLAGQSGYKANFNLVDTRKLNEMASKKIADDLFSEGSTLLDEAKRDNYKTARIAYERFNKLVEINTNYPQAKSKLDESYQIGQSHVLLSLVNNSTTLLPIDFERNLRIYDPENLDTKWVKYYNNRKDRKDFDYEIEMGINQIYVTRDDSKEDHHHFTAEIEDGFVYEYDSKGNVKKDSLGNDIKHVKKIKVKSLLVEVVQHKEALIYAEITLLSYQDKKILKQNPIQSKSEFNNAFVNTIGDERAIPHNWLTKKGGTIMGFPSDHNLILSAANKAVYDLQASINNFREHL